MDQEKTAAPLHVEPILAVNSVVETVEYWHDVLGFTEKWTWGEPPNHGGVVWNGTFIQFTQNSELASLSKGNSIFIRVRRLQALYTFHQKKKAEIVEPLENKPWGMAGYTVREINGYYVIFAGALLTDNRDTVNLPDSVRTVARSPTLEEYRHLTSSVGWSLYNENSIIEKILDAPVFAVIAEDTVKNEVIGCALLLGDHASFYYVKDVVVHPDWQSKHVGTAMMNKLNDWLDNNAADKAMVALITPESLAPFYQKFGFAPAFCMINHIQRKKA